jgi:DNA-binding NarL/FixJ family response regulator
MAAPHRIVIIEDDSDVRSLLEVMIDLDDRFELVGTAADGHAGVAIVRDLDPDAVILDLEMPGLTGLDTLGMIGSISPRARIVVFSAFPDPITLMDVLRLGADAYLDKATAWKELLPTVVGLCSMRALTS